VEITLAKSRKKLLKQQGKVFARALSVVILMGMTGLPLRYYWSNGVYSSHKSNSRVAGSKRSIKEVPCSRYLLVGQQALYLKEPLL